MGAGISCVCDYFSKALDAGPQQLAYHTDHRAVLEAMNQVLDNPQAAGFPPFKNGWAMVNGSQNAGPAPAALPAVLKDLHFEFMNIREPHKAIIYFGGGFGHWGFTNYVPDGSSHWELSHGLWYFTDEGGSFPRDTSKFPYYQTSKRLLMGGLALIALAIALHFRK